nr:MAG TPA: hypothetical protein [Caudoviricetes sp.]
MRGRSCEASEQAHALRAARADGGILGFFRRAEHVPGAGAHQGKRACGGGECGAIQGPAAGDRRHAAGGAGGRDGTN